MEIQWIIIAMKFMANKGDKLFNIIGIVHRVNMSKYKGIGTLELIAKVNMLPHEESMRKMLKLEIVHRDAIKTFEIPYTLPSWNIWINEYVPYISIPLRNMQFPESGEYTFRLIVDGELKNQESITAGYYGG